MSQKTRRDIRCSYNKVFSEKSLKCVPKSSKRGQYLVEKIASGKKDVSMLFPRNFVFNKEKQRCYLSPDSDVYEVQSTFQGQILPHRIKTKDLEKKIINPITGRIIQINGIVYKKLITQNKFTEQELSEYKLSKKILADMEERKSKGKCQRGEVYNNQSNSCVDIRTKTGHRVNTKLREKIHQVMHEFKLGELRDKKGVKITNRRKALSIAFGSMK